MNLLFSRSKIDLRHLKKLPKTILVVDTFFTVTEEQKKRTRMIMAGVEVDFEEQRTHYSLVIFCGLVLRFGLGNPLSLAEGEIWFTRRAFSDRVLADALRYYSDCEIRNGV